MRVSDFTVYIYRDVAAFDGLNNQRCACLWPTIISDHLRHKCKRLRARQHRNIRADLAVTAVTDKNAALLHMLSVTNRCVLCLLRGHFSLT